MPDLSFVREKIKRAEIHIHTADAIAKAHCESEFYGVEIKRYRKGWQHLRVTTVKPFPPDFSILIGEIAYQLRSGLDHIAFAFCVPKNPREQKGVQFPFASRKSEWRGTAANQLPGVSSRAKAVFERFQPYHRRKEPRVKLLWYLNAVNNWEKHRAPATAAFGVTFSQGRISGPGALHIKTLKYFNRRTIKSGAVLARIEIEEPLADSNVHIDSKTGFQPIFDKRMTKVAEMSVFHTLDGARLFMEQAVVPAFERLP